MVRILAFSPMTLHPMNHITNKNRRSILKMGLTGALAPMILPSRLWSASPNEKIRMGFIGTGKQMGGLLSRFLQYPEVEAVAVCDVDTNRRNAAKAVVDKHYGNSNCKAFNDFREITTDSSIDAVCIATPDHWHTIISLSAAENGKDIYCEKPLTHNIRESKILVDAVLKHKRVLQTGSMQRSMAEFRIASELVRNGVIGKIKTVDVSFGDPAKPCAFGEEAMEPGLDWKLWLGPAPFRPYHSELSPRGLHTHFPMGWRMSREYGGGMITDWGAHHIDIAHWALGVDGKGPVEIVAPKDWENAKRGAQLIYPDGVVLTHVNGKGASFFGENGEIHVNRGKFEVVIDGKTRAKFWDKDQDKGTSLQREYTLMEREFLTNAPVRLYKSADQLRDFLECVKSRKQPVCDVTIGASSADACHLMSFAYYYGANAKWDSEKGAFTEGGDSKWLTREYSEEWKM